MEKCFFNVIKYFDTIDSTNNELLKNDYNDKTLIYTFNQIKGRGRFERIWTTFQNRSLALSILLKNFKNFNIKYHFYITAILSITLVEMLEKYYRLKSYIKWPNDIYINGKKISGILTEAHYYNKDNYKIVSGIGININSSLEDLSIFENKATSIAIEKKDEINIKEFTEFYINELSNYLNYFINSHSSEYIINQTEKNNLYEKEKILKVKEKWLEYSNLSGKKVHISNVDIDMNKEKELIGVIIDITDEGLLKIQKDNNIYLIASGDLKIIEDRKSVV